MKKLLFIPLLFLTSLSYASALSLPSYVSSNDVIIANLNLTNTSIEDWSSNIEGGINIKAGSLVSADFSESVSIVKFRDEAFNDFTYSGMLPATSADLTSDISLGISYVDGVRINKNAESHTYTASKDTYVYISQGGYYVYEEVALGAAAPSTPANTLLLAKVTTDTDNITGVTDSRTLSIQITTTTTNFPANFRSQCFVSRDTTTTVHAEPGDLAIGSTIYSRLTDTSAKALATAGNWIEAGVPSLTTPIKVYVYAYNDSGSSWDIKYSSADPVYSDTSDNTGGVLRYYKSASVYYRAIGWAYVSADAVQTWAFSNFADHAIKKSTTILNSAYASLGSLTVPKDDTIPTSTEGNPVPNFNAVIVPLSPNALIRLSGFANFSVSGAADQVVIPIYKNNSSSAVGVTTGKVQDARAFTIPIHYETTAGTINPIQFSIRAGDDAGGTTVMNGNQAGGARNYGGVYYSKLVFEEVS